MSSRLDELFSSGMGHGIEISPYLQRNEARALHALGDTEFNKRLRKRFPREILFHHTGPAGTYLTYDGSPYFPKNNGVAWTVPIHITAESLEDIHERMEEAYEHIIVAERTFLEIINRIRRDPSSFTLPFLESVRGQESAYVTHMEYISKNETEGIIYLTFVSDEDLDEDLIKKRFYKISNFISPSHALFYNSFTIDADEITMEQDESKLGIRRRKRSKKTTKRRHRKNTKKSKNHKK